MFTALVSDELLTSVQGIVSSIVSKRQEVLVEIARAGGGALHSAQEAPDAPQLIIVEASTSDSASADMALSIFFEGLEIDLVNATQELARLHLDATTVGVKQTESGSLNLKVSVRALTMTDSCSPSKDRLSAIVSSDTSRPTPAEQEGLVRICWCSFLTGKARR